MGLKARKPTWKQRAAKALTESIAHWERLRDGRERDGEGPNGNSCACCHTFKPCNVAGEFSVCGKCPIAARTGRDQCSGTPFLDAYFAVADDSSDRQEACQAEVDFLIHALPAVARPMTGAH